MDPCIRTRTCIRACNQLPHELPGQTWPSLKSSLVFYFSLGLIIFSLYVQVKSIFLTTQDKVSSSSFSFSFPFPLSPIPLPPSQDSPQPKDLTIRTHFVTSSRSTRVASP